MAELAFDSTVNYQKIFMEGSVNLTVSNPAASTSTIVSHNLGYRPNVRIWFTDASGRICPASGNVVDYMLSGTTSAFAGRACYYQVYTNTVKIILSRNVTVGPSVSTTVYYRIYLDAA